MSEEQKDIEKNYHVLAVDDILENLQVLGSLLRESGVKFAFATSGKQALNSVASKLPDLILLDINMPEMDGFEVCEKLKSNPQTAEVPVIFLTAKTEAEDIVKGFQLGGVDYITKPFKKEELLTRVKMHIKMKRTEHELRELLKMRDRLFSIIGHDLRGPLGTLMMRMETFIDDDYDMDESAIKNNMQKLVDLTKRVYSLLDNLLSWARSQQQQVSFEPSLANLKKLIDDNIKVLESTAKNKSINITYIPDENENAFFDKNSISTVIRNILSNAIKFTREGGEIKITTKRLENTLQVSISDSGVGIPSEVIDDLFKPDKIVTTRGTSDEKGTGLGLKLCKDFIDKNSGKIWVESEIGKGATFHFTIPVSMPVRNS
jgi:two-component system, sensor histidine kinase and response regulator